MSEDSTAPPWWSAGQASHEASAGSEPTRPEPLFPPSSVPPPTSPLPASSPARDGEASLEQPWWVVDDVGPAVSAATGPTVPLATGSPVPAGSAGSAVPAPRRRGRRPWILALAVVAVAGLAAGLLVWAPWHQSPVAPTAVFATSRTATSVLVSWPASKGGAAPDHYLVLRDGKQVGSVPASRTSFTDNGLAPGSRHRYAIIAAAGGQRSASSVKTAAVTTITPSPVGLTVSRATWTTVTLRWSPSPLGPVPDKYRIFSGATLVGVVAGSADSYDSTGLSPAGSYHYEVAAVWGNTVSAPSVPFTALTLWPPLSGGVAVKVNTISTPGGGASLSVGDHWSDTWQFAGDCRVTRCTLTTDAELAAPGFVAKPFTMTLRGAGRSYSGTVQAQISACGSVKVTNTVTLSIAVKGTVVDGAWPAWTGTMKVISPYTTAGTEYCATQSWSFAVTGKPNYSLPTVGSP